VKEKTSLPLRRIRAENITKAVKKLFIDANTRLGRDVVSALRAGLKKEQSPLGRQVLEKIIENRIGKKAFGFGAEITTKTDLHSGELMKSLLPQDLIKFGLIPEFVGRVPVTVVLEGLDRAALVRVLKEPKNALLKQYWKIFGMDGVELEFTEEAIEEIALLAIERNTGARGLRAILEDIMLDIMYEIPSRKDIIKCVINRESVKNRKPPELIIGTRPKKRTRGSSERGIGA